MIADALAFAGVEASRWSEMAESRSRIGFAIGLGLFASIFLVSGFLHFFYPAPYVRIMPPMLPGR